MEVRARIGAELRALRLAAGLSMVKAASRAGVSRMTLHRWETDASAPEIAGLDRLLKGLGADERTRARLLADAAPTPALPELSNSPLGSPVHLGQALQALRAWKGIGQDALARAVGATQGTVARWEAGAFRPGDEALERLLTALDAPEGEAAWIRGLAHEEPIPFGGPLDAKAWLDANRPHDGNSRVVPLLVFEREVWRRAARDLRWEPLLVEAMGWRGWSHCCTKGGPCSQGLDAARRALALARRSGHWEEVVPAVAQLARAIREPERRERLYATVLERVHAPEWRVAIISERALSAREPARGEELLRPAQDLLLDERSAKGDFATQEMFHLDLAAVRLHAADFEGAMEAFEGTRLIRQGDYVRHPIQTHRYLLLTHRLGSPPRRDLVTAARSAQTEGGLIPYVRQDWRRTARTLGIDP